MATSPMQSMGQGKETKVKRADRLLLAVTKNKVVILLRFQCIFGQEIPEARCMLLEQALSLALDNNLPVGLLTPQMVLACPFLST